MKKSLLAILMAVLLVIAIPAAAMAAPPTTATVSPNCVKAPNNMSVTFSVVCIGRDTSLLTSNIVWKTDRRTHQTLGYMSGDVYYAGQISGATPDGIFTTGSPVAVIQDIDYVIDTTGKVVNGSESGSLVIDGYFVNPTSLNSSHPNSTVAYAGSDYANMRINSVISGNVSQVDGATAGDAGSWQTLKTGGSLKILAGSHGNWSATVTYSSTYGTFLGTATATGDLHR